MGIVLVGQPGPAVAFVAAAGLCESIGTVVFYAEAQVRLPREMEGRFFAVLIPYTDAFVVLGSVVAGAVVARGVTPAGWVIAAVMALPVMILAPVFLRRRGWTAPKKAAAADGPLSGLDS